MNYTLHEWLNLTFRWAHVFAGILWIGSTWYFTWLDRRFHTSDPDEVWMVHSGGFYQVRKLKTPSPAHTLHWFKWEAAFTWMTGVALLIIVYYFGGLMSDGEPGKLNSGRAILLGIATMFVGWMLYDLVLARNNLIAIVAGGAWAIGAPLRGFERLGELIAGVKFVDGVRAQKRIKQSRSVQQAAA